MQIDEKTVQQWARNSGMPSEIAGRISDVLMYVAQRAAEQEREACAQLCEHYGSTFDAMKAIRSRTKEQT